MFESHAFGRDRGSSAFLFAQDCMASITILADDLAIGADVLAVVTAETTQKIKVADVVVVSLPVQLHLRKSGAAINALQFADRVANLDLLGFLEIRVLAGIELVNLGSDAIHGFLGRLIGVGEGGHR